MKYRILVYFIGVFQILSISAKASANELLMACEQPQVSGLYKQCQEVKLIQQIGDRVRVFSRPDSRLLTLNISQIFSARLAEAATKFEKKSMIAIPGSYLWNNTPEGFQSLCIVENEQGPRLLSVSCGRHKNELIQRTNVFVLSPLQKAGIRPTSYSKK